MNDSRFVAGRNSSAGGARAASGLTFQGQVFAWWAAHAVGGVAPGLGLDPQVRVEAVGCETGFPVDDVGVALSNGGFILVQAKSGMRRLDPRAQDLRKAVDQLVSAMIGGLRPGAAMRTVEVSRDRLVIATNQDSSRAFGVLGPVCARVRDLPISLPLDAAAVNEDQKRAFAALLGIVRSSWTETTSREPDDDELRDFFRVLEVSRLDFENDAGADRIRCGVMLQRASIPQPFSVLVGIGIEAAQGRSWRDKRTLITAVCAGNPPEGYETSLTGRLLHLRHGQVPLVQDVDPMDLGVKPAIGVEGDTGLEASGRHIDLPLYVDRDSDGALEAAVSRGGIVLLHGRAASGKSRSAYEAIRRVSGESILLVPAYPTALRELLDAGYSVANAIVWLDDLEQYLVPGGLDVGLLEWLCPSGRQDVAVVATIRDEELARWRRAGLADYSDNDVATMRLERRISQLIIRLPRERLIAVGQYLTVAERENLAGRKSDPRVAAALLASRVSDNRVGFAEYLAAGPAMLDRWSVGDGALFDVGQALISVAVDCRRAGFERPLPAGLLARLHRRYVSPARRDRADLPSVEQGLAWACQPVLGASSCLSPRLEGTYLASDYLLDRTQAGIGPLAATVVPDEAWNALLAIDDPGQIASVGVHAAWAGREDLAEAAWRMATEAGEAGGVMNLGPLLAKQGRMDEAEEHWRRAAYAGWHDAMYELALILEERGDINSAKHWYKGAVEGDDPRAMNALGLLAEAEGRLKEAESWYRRAADVDGVIWLKHTDSMRNLASLLRRHGNVAEADYWDRIAIEHDERIERNESLPEIAEVDDSFENEQS
jgi:tetratricopeptide (TPR) repeat protein